MLIPKEIPYFSNKGLRVAMIAAGDQHSGAIVESISTQDAQVYFWGENCDHRLMAEDCHNRFEPQAAILEQVKL